MITCEWPSVEIPHAGSFVVKQVESLRLAGVHVEVFSFRGRMKLSNYWQAWRQARKVLSRQPYDLVHAQWGQSALLAFPKKIPLIVTFRGSDVNGIPGRNGKATIKGRALTTFSKLIARLADQTIVVSEQLISRLPKRTYHVIPSGLDLTLFRPMSQQFARRRLSLPENKLLVLFAANPKNILKRYDLAKAAVARLTKQLDVELVVANGCPHEMMPFYMNACDALVLTSMHEGSPNIVKEALACNLPIVSVDVGDVRQRLAGVQGCYICEDDSQQAIAQALSQVLSIRKRIDGRSLVDELDEKNIAQKIISVYNLIMTN